MLYLFAQGCFGSLVFVFFVLAVFKECLVTLVYDGRGLFEAFPYRVAQLFGYRTCFAPFVMQVLQLLECGYYIVLLGKFFGALAKGFFLFEIFLEVVVSELFVYFQQVVELLGIELVFLPQFGNGGGGDIGDGLEVLLYLLYSLVLFPHLVGVIYDGFQFIEQGILAG